MTRCKLFPAPADVKKKNYGKVGMPWRSMPGTESFTAFFWRLIIFSLVWRCIAKVWLRVSVKIPLRAPLDIILLMLGAARFFGALGVGQGKIQLPLAYPGLLQNTKHLLGHPLGQIHGAIFVVDFDMADIFTVDTRLVGYGTHQIARSHSVIAPHLHTVGFHIGVPVTRRFSAGLFICSRVITSGLIKSWLVATWSVAV